MQLQRIGLMFFISVFVAISAYFLCTHFLAHSRYVAELTTAIVSAYMWVPGICAIIYMKKEGMPFKIIKKPSKYVWVAFLIPLVFVILGVICTLLFAHFSTEGILAVAKQYHLNFQSSVLNIVVLVMCLYIIAVIATCTINFLFALGEELFWREYLWKKIKYQGFWKASLSIGLLWGLWHAPVIVLFGHNYPQHRLWGVVWMILWCVLVTPMFLYLRMKDKSLMAPTMLHGMLNAFAPICVVFFPMAHELLRAPLGVAGFIALIIMNGYLFRAEPGKFLVLDRA